MNNKKFVMPAFWQTIKKKFEETTPNETIPSEIIEILSSAGYDNSMSLTDISNDDINAIEIFWRKESRTEEFSFLPGQTKFIKELGKKIVQYEQMDYKRNQFALSNASLIMREMFNNLKQNQNVAPTGRRYSEILQWFGTYIFMLSGKAAYEVLCSNLPLPQAATVCKSTK